MPSIIDELYFGNISPLERYEAESPEILRLRRQSGKVYQAFRDMLKKEPERLAAFDSLMDQEGERSGLQEQEMFRLGFSLGMQLGMESFGVYHML